MTILNSSAKSYWDVFNMWPSEIDRKKSRQNILNIKKIKNILLIHISMNVM